LDSCLHLERDLKDTKQNMNYLEDEGLIYSFYYLQYLQVYVQNETTRNKQFFLYKIKEINIPSHRIRMDRHMEMVSMIMKWPWSREYYYPHLHHHHHHLFLLRMTDLVHHH